MKELAIGFVMSLLGKLAPKRTHLLDENKTMKPMRGTDTNGFAFEKPRAMALHQQFPTRLFTSPFRISLICSSSPLKRPLGAHDLI
jgi:hypothetical protein